MSSSTSDHTTVYFGYGSNLWKDQMLQRCPTSTYIGIARLENYKWLINDRGYANVVQTGPTNSTDANATDEVWGLVYTLLPPDEANLDINEGVPVAYTKENLTVSYWPTRKDSDDKPNTEEKPEERDMLVYIDRNRTEPDKPKKEYIYRMNMGIRDATAEGMPESYVEEVLRPFIPEEMDSKIEGFARQQAVLFVDETGSDEKS